MKIRVSVVVVTLSATFVSASSLGHRQNGFPQCAMPCVTNTTEIAKSGCSATNNTCFCTNQQFVADETKCIQTLCSGTDLQNANAVSEAICKSVGVTLAVVVARATSNVDSVATAAATTSKSAAIAVTIGRNAALLGGLAAVASFLL